ncbi:tetratricopeptide repeat protein [Collimonas pratensis]|uniref:protein O-GlcNAc transferase n=1 Tax=Collimonas pratensis TaxID=279113 RepID=A0ABM5ZAX2_9BURK|nr:tetratricopeptide repeat protein [Collimonas pratensis]AMP16328.1 TPR repeat family protein [Collimonas pratensis]
MKQRQGQIKMQVKRLPAHRQADENRYNRALQCYQQGDYDTALKECQQLLARPLMASRVILLVGVLQYLQNDLAAAEISLREAVKKIGSSEAYFNLALALGAQKKPQEAEAAYRKTLAMNPSQAQAWNNLGNILRNGHDPLRFQEAVTCYQRALQIRPGYVRAHTNLGLTYVELKDKDNAELHYNKALALEPDFVPALSNMAAMHESGAQPELALPYHLRALRLQPGNAKLMANVIALRRQIADWSDDNGPQPADLVQLMSSANDDVGGPLSMLAWPEFSPALQRETARRFARSRWAHELGQPPLVSEVAPHAGRRIRLGYLSADFRNHPVTHLITDIIAHHDRENFEVFLYAYGPSAEDKQRQALRQAAEHFVDVSSISDSGAAHRIKDDGIDVLVDLTGYTTHARLGITALRPAPVIASWLGYIGSLGEPRLADYVIGDAVATPPEHADHFSESLALMPHCYQPNQALAPIAAPPSRQSEGLPDDAFVFCSFNQCFKLTPSLWDDWCQILNAVPHSVLWLAPMKAAACSNLRREAQQRGVAPERLVFAARRPLAEHQSRLALADLALDTMPYNSGTTASDALRAGVPLVTAAGSTFVSRMAASLLHNLGMDGLIAADRRSYVDLAIALASDPARLQECRSALQDALQASLLFDPQRFSADLENLFRAMLAQRARGERGVVTTDDALNKRS